MSKKRGVGKRQVPPRFILVCEGQTERGYFQAVNQLLRLAGISVKAVQDEVSPLAIVDRAKDYITGNPKRGIEAVEKQDQVWVVFDWDEHTDEVVRARKKAEGLGIHVALSNPCFDVWLIWHLEDYMRVGCLARQTDAELKKVWPSYSKGADNPWAALWTGLRKDGLHEASRRAREADAKLRSDNLAYPENRPSSEVLELMDAIKDVWEKTARRGTGECPVG